MKTLKIAPILLLQIIMAHGAWAEYRNEPPETIDLWWTGNRNRLGGQGQNFRITEGFTGQYYPRAYWGDQFNENGISSDEPHDFNIVFDTGLLEGPGQSMFVNRDNVRFRHLVFNAEPGDGFTITDQQGNTRGTTLIEGVAVHGGSHQIAPQETPYNDFWEMVADTTWNMAADADLQVSLQLRGNYGLIKEGEGTLVMTNDHLYFGNTTINSGVFGVAGGDASLAGGLHFAGGARLLFSQLHTLVVSGQVTFEGPFGVNELAGLDPRTPVGNYMLIEGPVDFSGLSDFGSENAVDIGNGASAFFQSAFGGLELVVTRPSHIPFTADFGTVRLIELFDPPVGVGYVLGEARTGYSPYLEEGYEVREWQNQSTWGSGIAMRQPDPNHRPTLLADAVNGHPAIRFNRRAGRGDGDMLLLERQDAGGAAPLLDTNKISWTFVFRSLDRLADQQWIASWHREGGHGNGDLSSLISSAGELAVNVRDNSGENIGAGDQYPLEDNDWLVVTVVWDGESGRLAHFINGEEFDAEESAAVISMPLTWETLVFGNRRTMLRPLAGDLAEFVLYNEVITDEVRLANEKWLDQKYGLGIFDEGEAPDALAESGRVLHFDAGSGVVTAAAVEIVSMPPELEGNAAVLTFNANSNWPENQRFLTFDLARPVTVFIANDPAFEPQWLQRLGFSRTGMIVGTTAGIFDLWERAYGARDFVSLPGNGDSGDGNNYWVILGERSEALSDSPEHFVMNPSQDWTLERHYWQLATDPEGGLHTASLVTTRVGNFTPETGFRIAVDFRVPQLQHAGGNAYGLVLLGDFMEQRQTFDPASGIRAEWLPREAGGGATLRLVNNATGAVLDSAAWGGEAPVRTNDWVEGDPRIELFWDSRSSELPCTYFTDDETKEILRLPDGLDPNFLMEGIKTANDLSNASETFLQFTVQSGNPGDGNQGVTVFVAWDVRNSGFEPAWLVSGFERTDHLIEVSSEARYHRLWAKEVQEGAQVTLPGASAGGGGPYPEGTDNYFVLLGDIRPGLETIYRLEAEGTHNGTVWTVSATLTDQTGFSQAVSASLSDGMGENNNLFGVVIHHPERVDTGQDPVTPIWQTLAMSMDFHTPPLLTGFSAWQEYHFTPAQLLDAGISGPMAAPAGDGVMNLIKYAFNLLPFVAAVSQDLPRADVDAEGHLILVYRERTDADDILYVPEVSDDLGPWRNGPGHITEVNRHFVGENLQEVIVRGQLSEGADKGFMRLRLDIFRINT